LGKGFVRVEGKAAKCGGGAKGERKTGERGGLGKHDEKA